MNIHTIILAKAPVAGHAKTRLIPALGAEGAACFAKDMLLKTLDTAMNAALGTVELCFTDAQSSIWETIKLPASIERSEQTQGDLGQRMANAARPHLKNNTSVILMGTDCPSLTPDHLREAANALRHHDAVMLPTHDGGYCLLGLKTEQTTLFEAMPWSTAAVAAITRQRCAMLGLRLCEGDTLRDIDRPEDLSDEQRRTFRR